MFGTGNLALHSNRISATLSSLTFHNHQIVAIIDTYLHVEYKQVNTPPHCCLYDIYIYIYYRKISLLA